MRARRSTNAGSRPRPPLTGGPSTAGARWKNVSGDSPFFPPRKNTSGYPLARAVHAIAALARKYGLAQGSGGIGSCRPARRRPTRYAPVCSAVPSRSSKRFRQRSLSAHYFACPSLSRRRNNPRSRAVPYLAPDLQRSTTRYRDRPERRRACLSLRFVAACLQRSFNSPERRPYEGTCANTPRSLRSYFFYSSSRSKHLLP